LPKLLTVGIQHFGDESPSKFPIIASFISVITHNQLSVLSCKSSESTLMNVFNDVMFFSPGSISNLLFTSRAKQNRDAGLFKNSFSFSTESIPIPPLKKKGLVDG